MNRCKAFIKLGRPHQYIKNILLFMPLFFGYQITNLYALKAVFWAFVSFCMAASAQYVLNDIKDRREDQNHPIKSQRPIASGSVNVSEGIVFFLVLSGFSATIALIFLADKFMVILGGYFFLNILYSFYLKHMPVLDIVCVATSYVLRILAGAAAANLYPSHWLILMTFLLALFIVLAKRRDDLILFRSGKETRKNIKHYNFEFVSGAMMVMASVTVVSYISYTLSPEIMAKHNSSNLYLTTFFVIVGFLRYMHITFVQEKSGSPTKIILKDFFLQIVVLLWLIMFAVLLYVDGV